MKNPSAHKKCKSLFFKLNYLSAQANVVSPDPEFVPHIEEPSVSLTLDTCTALRRSERKQLKFQSDWKSEENRRCILCDENMKDDKGRRVSITLLADTEKATPTLKVFAEIHINLETKYKEGAKRLLLALTTVNDMVAANVGYHRQCYNRFRSPHWQKKVTEKDAGKDAIEKSDLWADFAQLIEIHVVIREEVYSLIQLTELYNELNEVK